MKLLFTFMSQTGAKKKISSELPSIHNSYVIGIVRFFCSSMLLATFHNNEMNSKEISRSQILSFGIIQKQWFQESKISVFLGKLLPQNCFTYETNFLNFQRFFFYYLGNLTVYNHKGLYNVKCLLHV